MSSKMAGISNRTSQPCKNSQKHLDASMTGSSRKQKCGSCKGCNGLVSPKSSHSDKEHIWITDTSITSPRIQDFCKQIALENRERCIDFTKRIQTLNSELDANKVVSNHSPGLGKF